MSRPAEGLQRLQCEVVPYAAPHVLLCYSVLLPGSGGSTECLGELHLPF